MGWGWPGLIRVVLGLLMALGAMTAITANAAEPGQPLVLQQALRVEATATEDTAPNPNGQTGLDRVKVRLPDPAPAHQLDRPGLLTYQLEFTREQLDRALGTGSTVDAGRQRIAGLYVERACSELTVWLNGMMVHQSPNRDLNRFKDCYEPQLIALPLTLADRDTNVLELRVEGWPLAWVSTARRAIGLSELMLGDHGQLKRLHQQEMILSSGLPAITSGALALLGVLTLCLLAFAPAQRHLAYFATLSLLWAAINVRGWWSLPVDEPLLREGLLVVMTAMVGWSFQRFVFLYSDLPPSWLDAVARIQPVLMAALVALAGTEHLFQVGAVCNTVQALLIASTIAVFFMHVKEPRRRPMRGMAVVFGLGLIFVAVELVVSLGWVQAQPYLPLRWGIPLCVVMVGGLQMMQFGRQAHQLESMQRQLQSRIDAARQEIEGNFTRLAEDRIEQVTAGERKRIAADLHDDLGAKLLTIVHTSRSDRIATLGREALDEMRLSVRGLTGRPMELSEALADWRTEAMARLSPTAIDLDWPLPLEDLPQVLGARAMVQTTRILREVFNNLIRHSQASHCAVLTEVLDNHLIINIQDNGSGFEIERMQGNQAGLGLLNMQHRARQLRGDCTIESTPGRGTRTRLRLPLEQAAA